MIFRKEYTQEECAFQPLPPSPIVLNLSTCHSLGEIHLLLKKTFGFPQYYGENWDALWDCLSGLFWKEGPYVVEIHGFHTLPDDLHEACLIMLKVFEDVHQETPNVVFEIHS